MKLNKFIAFGYLVAGIGFTSCEDWLTIYPNSQIVEENFWEDKNDLLSVRYAAYRNMLTSSSTDRYMYWGEMRSDNFQAHPDHNSETINHLMKADLSATDAYSDWSIFYNTINLCNKVLEHGEDIKAKDISFTDTDWLPIQAEMIALRALNYFYLVRAFGNVPYVTQSIDDDSQVVMHPATSQMDILTDCINQMEAVKDNAVNNFGTTSDNKGFITKNAIYTILADMYLWRGSIYEGMGRTGEAANDYMACNEKSQIVIDEVRRQQNENSYGMGSSIGSGSTSGSTEDEYPLIQYNLSSTGNSSIGSSSSSSGPYNQIFGTGNSTESIFELQCSDEEGNANGIIGTYYYGDNNLVLASDYVKNVSSQVDNGKAHGNVFYTTDMRKQETTETNSTTSLCYIRKYAYSSVTHGNYESNTADDTPTQFLSTTYRSKAGDANWIIYRVSEVMLMKAEALCRLGSEDNLKEAFKLVEAIYKRSNPYPYAKNLNTGKLDSNGYGTIEAMEGLILRERQREFIGEGKRWFDLVRFAVRRSDITDANSTTPDEFKNIVCIGTDSEKLKKKMVNMQSLYMPLNETELKANTLLKQNPVWDKNQTISKN